MRVLVAFLLAAADAAHVPVPQHALQMDADFTSNMEKMLRKEHIEIPKEIKIVMIREELDVNAADHKWGEIQNFMVIADNSIISI